jgi:hypothetical protein
MAGDMSGTPSEPGLMFRLFVHVMVTVQGWLHMTCKHFIRRASDKYERRLGFGERILQALHRGICSICKIQERHMDQLREVARELGQASNDSAELGKPDDPDKHQQARLSPEAVERIRAAMSRADRN